MIDYQESPVASQLPNKDTIGYFREIIANIKMKFFSMYDGSNQSLGSATLVAGTKTVTNTRVTANTRIFLTTQALGTVAAPKAIAVTARVAGTSFTITSADSSDTSTIAWMLVEPIS